MRLQSLHKGRKNVQGGERVTHYLSTCYGVVLSNWQWTGENKRY